MLGLLFQILIKDLKKERNTEMGKFDANSYGAERISDKLRANKM